MTGAAQPSSGVPPVPEADYGRGDIDLNHRPLVENGDGTYSTVRSMSFQDEDGREVLIPTAVGGKVVSDEEAIRYYRRTGEYLGKFSSVKEADRYAEALHEQQAKRYDRQRKTRKGN